MYGAQWRMLVRRVRRGGAAAVRARGGRAVARSIGADGMCVRVSTHARR